MCSPPQAVIFDFDGTLVQTRLASWEIFRGVNEEFGLGVDTAERFYELFGNNFFASLRQLCRDEQHARDVTRAFNEALKTAYHPPMVPGITDVVRNLAPHCTLAVLSSNATSVLRRILRENELAFCFAHVFGGDVEPDKQRGIQRFLADAAQGAGRRCEVFYDEGQPVSHCEHAAAVLVTDTVGDVQAAVAGGIRAVGVSWGMHSEAELLDAGCEFVAIWPQELLSCLLDLTAAEPTACSCPVGGTAEQLRQSGAIRRRRRTELTTGQAPAIESMDGLLDEQLREAMRRLLS